MKGHGFDLRVREIFFHSIHWNEKEEVCDRHQATSDDVHIKEKIVVLNTSNKFIIFLEV